MTIRLQVKPLGDWFQLTGPYSGLDDNGKKTSGLITFTAEDQDHWTIKITEAKVDGASLPDGTAKFSRHRGN